MKNYHSLRNNREFQMVYNEGNSKANRYLVLYYRKNDLEYNRLGISVSKKVGNSVVRHRTTRLIRESYRLNQDNLKTGYDMVVIARQTAKGQNYHTIESAFASSEEELITIEEDFNIHYQVLQKIFIEIKGKRNMYICSDLFGICHRSIGETRGCQRKSFGNF